MTGSGAGAADKREETMADEENPPDRPPRDGQRQRPSGGDMKTPAPPVDREEAAAAREVTVSLREDAAHLREEAANQREKTARFREKVVRGLEDAAQARSDLEQLLAQMRDANERLVLTSIRAQTMTEDAEQASHLKDEFLAMVSHELRTPLSAVLGWARMVAEKKLPPEGANRAIETIERNAAVLAHIVDDLLDASRIIAGTLQPARQPVDLVVIAQAALEAVRPLALTRNVRLEFSPHPSARERVTGDAARLQQVISNLLTNAVKFTPAGGRVGVFIERTNGHMEIRVVDTGQGISPAFLPHIFERFRQADVGSTRRHAGLGLGLAIVHQLVELHGGSVHAASEGEGRGATFTVRLPISAAAVEPARPSAVGDRRASESASSPRVRLPQLNHLRILVVDDDDDGRTLTSLIFSQAGARVTAVASVREALHVLEAERPDVLVSDISLPDEDGYVLIGRIRQHEAEHGGFLPAVALTGYARAEDRVGILAAGFQAHVRKPVDSVELTRTIATVTQHLKGGET
jgi:signal transduction histidine kinase/CheY-like chemotaxis protein